MLCARQTTASRPGDGELSAESVRVTAEGEAGAVRLVRIRVYASGRVGGDDHHGRAAR